jgi:aspartyl-tRNA(Asn)/glutamyl-tRNA(Gln) amidotransferase subunit B
MSDTATLRKEDFEAVIGLEVHVELQTASKMFCSCSARTFGEEPNTHVCPVCLGMPGTLPVPNRTAVEWALKIALALNCRINRFSQFHRKNYFYPDMPKDYQISQYDYPLGVDGYLEVETSEGEKRFRIHRVHLEEDTGKLIHIGKSGRISEADYSLVDFNRAGIPLVEIVSEADMRSPEDAKAYMQALRTLLLTLDVSDCNLEEGSMRCDANVSVRPRGSTEFGTKTEVKNLNSFRSLERALAYEIERQIDVILGGGSVVQETRHYDDANKRTLTLRTKEEAHDYRYFPDPDLVPMEFDDALIERIRASLPELPRERKERFVKDYGLKPHDAAILTREREVADFFEEAASLAGDAQLVANWLLSELMYHLNEAGLDIDECAVTPRHLADLVRLLKEGTISGKIAKEVFAISFETGKLPSVIVEEKGLIQISDESALEPLVEQVILENPQAVEDYRAGKSAAIGFLVGQVMKLTRGKANPQLVSEMLRRKLG